jgi:hypothetical protein
MPLPIADDLSTFNPHRLDQHARFSGHAPDTVFHNVKTTTGRRETRSADACEIKVCAARAEALAVHRRSARASV